MIFKKEIFILILIVFLALILRVWNLESYPSGFNADEASIGYNAYSLIKTGRDEYGTFLPITFKSFADYKPGLYFYLVIPFVYLMGLSELAVRLPSALLGVGTVVLIYFLSKKIFNSSVGLISALFLTITPWHIHFSRGGWESNAGTFFITLGSYFLIKYLNVQKGFFLSLFSFLISMYLYQSPRLIVPVFLLLVTIFFWKQIVRAYQSKRNLFLSLVKPLIILLLLSLPLIWQLIGGNATSRFSGLSFLSDKGPESRINELRGEHANLDSTEAKLLHNKLTAYGPDWLGHFLDHFSPNFLFINGDEVTRNKVPESGEFYLIFSIFLIVGLLKLMVADFKYKKILFIWILTGVIPASLTFQTPSALRALNIVVPLVVITSFGFWTISQYFKNNRKYLFYLIVAVMLLFETAHYLESYFIHYPKRYPLAWEYGFSQMISKLSAIENNYNKVVITDRYDQPYILLLFYKAKQNPSFNPADYQSKLVLKERDKFNFSTIRGFDKYEFRRIDPEEVKTAEKTLFIGTKEELPGNTNIVDQVDFPNGEKAFVFVGR